MHTTVHNEQIDTSAVLRILLAEDVEVLKSEDNKELFIEEDDDDWDAR